MAIRVLLLSDASNPHTMRWASGLSTKEIEVVIFSLSEPDNVQFWKDLEIKVFFPKILSNKLSSSSQNLKKFFYPFCILFLLKLVINYRPTVIHAHHASSYGLLGALVFIHRPYFISVWGSDVFEFPLKSWFHRLILKFNLSRASKIFSTSQVMKKQALKYTKKEIEVIPFGIDLNLFYRREKKTSEFFTIGIVKSLEFKYGIQFLIEAFAIVQKEFSDLSFQLLIVGGGSDELRLRQLVKDLGINQSVTFVGRVPIKEVPYYQNLLDIAVYPSICEESFGVAVVESCACEVPVIVTRKGGLVEVVEEDITGLVVRPNDPHDIAKALSTLIKNPELRSKLGSAGRKRVASLYNWAENLEAMKLHYFDVNE